MLKLIKYKFDPLPGIFHFFYMGAFLDPLTGAGFRFFLYMVRFRIHIRGRIFVTLVYISYNLGYLQEESPEVKGKQRAGCGLLVEGSILTSVY